MHRRTFLAGSTAATATTALLAGCSDLTGLVAGESIDETVGDGETTAFSADAGAQLSISVSVEEIAEPDDDTTVHSEAISFRLDHADNGPLEMRMIEESETFEVTVEDDGDHIVIVTNGVARVSVDEVRASARLVGPIVTAREKSSPRAYGAGVSPS